MWGSRAAHRAFALWGMALCHLLLRLACMKGMGRYFCPCGFETWLLFYHCPVCHREMPLVPWKLTRADWDLLKTHKIDPGEEKPIYPTRKAN